MRRNVRPLRRGESGKMRAVNGGWMWHGWALQKWGVAGSATTPQIAGIEHRQLVHKVFWPAYATINAVKALRRRLDMQKKKKKTKTETKIKLKLVHY